MIEFVLTFFVAMLGGAVGSFLNVVVWRLPNKLSLIQPGSFCPKCQHPIRFYDNIPILGWLFLNGKCRDCKQPISFRYPLIETICFVMTGFIFYMIVFCGWTPSESSFLYWEGMKNFLFPPQDSIDSVQFFPAVNFESLLQTGFLLTALWSAFLFSFLAIALIEWDQNKIPISLMIWIGCLFLISYIVEILGHNPHKEHYILFLILQVTIFVLFYPVSKQENFKTCYWLALIAGLLCGYDFLIPIGTLNIPIFGAVLLAGPISYICFRFTGKEANLMILFLLTILFLIF
ncbi:MAG: prepilin peptidase [Planctomycetia bacterium]|nr:prepilin peptidase [Planctomycetia bacterium]